MKKLLKASLLILCTLLISCKNENSDKYLLNKPVWDLEDYNEVVREIRFGTPEGEKLPTEETNPALFDRLTNNQNISKILDDKSLGLKYRAEYSEKLFSLWKELIEEYSEKDRQDKFLYPNELVKLRDSWCYIEVRYFKLGNDNITKNAVNPEDVETLLKSNQEILISNFENNLTFLTEEDALDNNSVKEYSKTLEKSYNDLLTEFPNADYSKTLVMIDDLLKKVKSQDLIQTLSNLKQKLLTTVKPLQTEE